jgi:L-asparaginase / beta-aspartyl-peptidase
MTARQHPDKPEFVIAVHGGAGVMERSRMTRDAEHAYRAGLTDALSAGRDVLASGRSSLDAVVAAVAAFEDHPLFNAGRGACFTADGTNELDAAVMDGATLRAGAVTLVTTVKNPVKLARLVMDKTQHVMLAGEGAQALAREHGLDIVERSYFYTERSWKAFQRVKAFVDTPQAATLTEADKHGTVGAVALDVNGNLAAATSTGGRNNKRSGRVGDTPVIGAGTYANNATAAVSCTGDGEYFMRAVAAYTVSALMEFNGWSLDRAAKHVIFDRLPQMGGSGGLIALDRGGNVAMPFSTAGMYRGYVKADGTTLVEIFKEHVSPTSS